MSVRAIIVYECKGRMPTSFNKSAETNSYVNMNEHAQGQTNKKTQSKTHISLVTGCGHMLRNVYLLLVKKLTILSQILLDTN